MCEAWLEAVMFEDLKSRMKLGSRWSRIGRGASDRRTLADYEANHPFTTGVRRAQYRLQR